jgi:Tfp pilus assembly protein FimT
MQEIGAWPLGKMDARALFSPQSLKPGRQGRAGGGTGRWNAWMLLLPTAGCREDAGDQATLRPLRLKITQEMRIFSACTVPRNNKTLPGNPWQGFEILDLKP